MLWRRAAAGGEVKPLPIAMGRGEGVGIGLVLLGVGVRALTAAATRQRVIDALLLPLSVVLMTRIAAQAIWWRWRYGGPRWKGRTIVQQDSSQSQQIFTLKTPMTVKIKKN